MAATFKLKRKTFSSKKDREVCPPEAAEKARNGEGVVQKINGEWRIISLKTNPPTLWPASYSSKEKAESALSAYHANH